MNECFSKTIEDKRFGKLRMVFIDRMPFYVAADVARILGYKKSYSLLRNCPQRFQRVVKDSSICSNQKGLALISKTGLIFVFSQTRMKYPANAELQQWLFDGIWDLLADHSDQHPVFSEKDNNGTNFDNPILPQTFERDERIVLIEKSLDMFASLVLLIIKKILP